MMQRSLKQSVALTVETVPTSHPPGTEAGLWYWEFSTAGGGVAHQQQTALPTVEVSLAPGSYIIQVRLEDKSRQPIGDTSQTILDVPNPAVIIQTAGSITVEML